MEVYAVMSPSRMTNSFYRRILPRLALCAFIGLSLSALRQPGEPSSANSIGPNRNGTLNRVSLTQQPDLLARRVAGLSSRLLLRQLPVIDGDFSNSLSMASGDFDQDGVRDLIVGHAGSGHFGVTLYRGDPDALYPDSPEARQRKAINKESPSLQSATLLTVAEPPDFLAAGDFNGDGHLDIASAARGGNGLYVMTGNGRGGFAPAQRIELQGRVTTMAGGNADDAAGSNSLAIGLVGRSGGEAMLFESRSGSIGAPTGIMSLPGEAKAIAFSRSAGNGKADLLVAAGNELLFVLGEDQLTAVHSGGTRFRESVIHHRLFSSSIVSIATGNFIGHHDADVALLTADGTLYLLAEDSSRNGETAGWVSEGVAVGAWPGATSIVRARVSGSQADDLLIVDPSNRSLRLVAQEAPDPAAGAFAAARVSASLDVEGEPSAVLPMRLSPNAFDDLVILKSGQVAPTSVHAAAALTFAVTTTNDNPGGVDPAPGAGTGTLRQAIVDANANAGADTIQFSIAGPAPHTIAPLAPLPAITESVTINGTSNPDFSGAPVIELNGESAGVSNGLVINAPSCTVNGLIINRFATDGVSGGNGIVITTNGNIIQTNFIGTNATGSFAQGNARDGVFISSSSGNLVGGTTAAARNLLSGNRNGVQIFGVGTGNQVRGNSIGTNASGTFSLGNSQNGVLVLGASSSVIGEAGSASSNTISFNGAAGVAVQSGTNNSIQSNSIVFNGGLGIDLGATGVNANDTGDGDGGANNLQNYPVITSASPSGPGTTVVGTLNSAANTLFRLEFFSQQFPNASGFGEGQTLIGFANVTTDASGNASFNPTFAVTVPAGQVITATATDPAGNTSEFSKAVQVGGVSGGQAADLSVLVSIAPNPVETGSNVTKTIIVTNAGPGTATSVTVTDVLSANTTFQSCSATGGGVCGGSGNNRTVTFASFAPGTSAVITIIARVNCSVSNGTIVGNTAMVFSPTTPDPNLLNNVASGSTIATNPAPTITCPPNIVQGNDFGACTGTVNYVTPFVFDNCTGAGVVCSPPAGSQFAIGTTTVNCLARDAGGATATCSFTVTVNDVQPINIVCPPSLSITASPGQCSPIVSFPAPTVVDNCPGSQVTCVPPSGTSFPLGTTNVICTARDATGGQATCGFTVTVNGAPQAFVVLEGNGPALVFGPISANKKSRSQDKQPDRNFTVENIGCQPLVLTLSSISRTGRDVDRGRIADPEDTKLFSVSLVQAIGVETPLEILSDVRILAGEKKTFKVRFNPVIPAVAKQTSGLSADQVLPDLITSAITFTQNIGAPLVIDLIGHVDTEVRLTHPTKPKKGAKIFFSRSGNEFVIEYTIYDSNLDVKSATYQFFDRNRRPAGGPLSVSLTQLIQQRGLVTGQSFTVVQRITGANDHGEIVGVEVTVFDTESSTSASNNWVSRTSAASQPSVPKTEADSTSLRSAGLILSLENSQTPNKSGSAVKNAARTRARKEK
jgi:uncharacterized repeat protein (TIGR01451 family)